MSTPHIVLLDAEGIAPSVKLKKLPFAHTWQSYSFTEPHQLVERLQQAHAVMSCSVALRAEHLEQLPKLKLISLALTGTDIVDLDYCREHGIIVTNVPGYAANTVTEHVLAVMFELLRKPMAYHRLMQKLHRGEIAPKGIWLDYPVRDVAAKTLGIIGYGVIAQYLAQRARALGMRVVFYNRQGRYTGEDFIPMPQLLTEADVLSIHVPLTEQTRGMIGAAELAQMKTDAVIINTARGGIVDEQALINALSNNQIGGAAIDVLVDEPVQADNPLFKLIDHDDFILTPHVAWSSEDAMQGLMDSAVDNIARFIESSG
ncbi:glycerate dehydrogenase [Ventosimonas gracilis]|uniref:Glycerate dehydrogenase n=1 Tax=Ventosimonas gracilis TaxID=1680762 RepID=A0A139SP22_9GAMM|nr:NAD(P)-dependent oxidoreductase [Ventosimonas gracilis]KXU36307.1 glycerate dehydrogenase [Ventosimonas gracilis]